MSSMYIITYKGRPAPLRRLCVAEQREDIIHRDSEEMNKILASTSRKKTIDLYLFWFGFSWSTRAEGIDIKRIEA